MFIVVGEWANCVAVFQNLVRFGIFDYTHPKNFKDCFDVAAKQGYLIEEDRYWTNNPLIVDLFEPENVIVVDKDKNQFALSSHPEINHWREEMSSGELWSMFGEDFWNK